MNPPFNGFYVKLLRLPLKFYAALLAFARALVHYPIPCSRQPIVDFPPSSMVPRRGQAA
jgi:hypothetical protein